MKKIIQRHQPLFQLTKQQKMESQLNKTANSFGIHKSKKSLQ